tara:strand:- start:32623 stop:32892 length:270 start_codon:yes stop_codon:yes gene_type:complete
MNKQVEDAEVVAETPEPQVQDGLSLQDIANALQIIDIAVSRGAIKGEETSSVGMVRDRLAGFLKSAQEAQQANVAEGDSPDATNDSDES